MVLLARTQDPSENIKPSNCLSLFYADLKIGKAKGQVQVSPIKKMGGKAVDANAVSVFPSYKGTLSDVMHIRFSLTILK